MALSSFVRSHYTGRLLYKVKVEVTMRFLWLAVRRAGRGGGPAARRPPPPGGRGGGASGRGGRAFPSPPRGGGPPPPPAADYAVAAWTFKKRSQSAIDYFSAIQYGNWVCADRSQFGQERPVEVAIPFE